MGHTALFVTFISLSFTFLPCSFSHNAFPKLTRDVACNVTMNPSFCKSIIPPRSLSNLYGYGKYLLSRSLDRSSMLSSLIDRTIKDMKPSLPQQAAGALKDCLLLSQLTTDFLISSTTTLNDTSSPTAIDVVGQADLVQTLLSGIVTNQQTCLDGLIQSNFRQRGHNLFKTLVDGTELYKASLDVFAHSRPLKSRKADDPGRQLLDELRVGADGAFRWFNKYISQFSHPERRMALQPVVNVVVAQDGTGNYSTIGEAIAGAPTNNDGNKGFYVIKVKAGVYHEYVTVGQSKKYVMMVGDGIGNTIITGSHNVVDGSTTFNSATLAVVGEGFVAIGITIRNTAGPTKGQAVAVRNGAERSAFYKCSFEGYQDTLYTHSLRQFYRECDIYGTVDFIFGNAAAVFQNCNIYARLGDGNTNTVTAQSRSDPNQNTGTSIINCNILAAFDNTNVKTFLGRPWGEYSRVVVMQSYLGSLINPSGWMPWSGDFALKTLYYGEYKNSGPGSDTSRRVTWRGYHRMTAKDAGGFTVSKFLQGDAWLPKTTVAYTGGLV